jgi:hypothetical protein
MFQITSLDANYKAEALLRSFIYDVRAESRVTAAMLHNQQGRREIYCQGSRSDHTTEQQIRFFKLKLKAYEVNIFKYTKLSMIELAI